MGVKAPVYLISLFRSPNPHRELHLIEYALRWRWGLMLLGLVTLGILFPFSQRLATEQSVASLFGDNDPTLADYRKLKDWFGRNDILVLMYRDDDLASEAGIARSRTLTQKLKSLAGVTATLSPSVLNRAAVGMEPEKLLPLAFGQPVEKGAEIPKLMRPDDPVGRGLSRVFAGYTHAEDYSHAAVVAMMDDTSGANTIDEIKGIAREWKDEPGVSDVSLIGEPVLVEEAFALVRRDGARLAVVTVTLLSLVVMFTLFDYRLVVLLSLVIGWSVIVTKATMYLSGIPLSLIASILTAIVTVVAVTAVLHVGVRYHSRRARGFPSDESTRDVIEQLAAPIFWTCATDAAGFAALWFSEIMPVRQFGLMVAMSAVAVFVAIVLFAPGCLTFPEWRLAASATRVRRSITRTLRRKCNTLARWFVARRGFTVSAAIVLMFVSVVVVTRSETETSFLRNFRDDSSIVIHYGNVEKNLGGAGVWDLVLDVPAELSNEFMSQVLELEAELMNRLGGKDGLSKAISIADATEVLGRSTAGKWMTAPVRIAAMRTRLPTFIGALISDPVQSPGGERRKLRIMLRSSEGLAADKKRSLIDGAQRIAIKHIAKWESIDEGKAANRVIVTGYYVIMTRLVDQLVSDQWRCFAASAILIWLLMMCATRSVRLASAALLPNLLPAFLVLATVALSGGRINMGAAMIAAVSVGLSIDGSVHLLTAFRRKRVFGHDDSTSAVSAAGNIGAAVMLATVALVAGFSVLSTSEFIPTATFGTLVAWTLVMGTLINLSVLPALVGGGSRE